jgi:hypothetical protein
MSGPTRDPKSKQSGGDLKISLTAACLFVVAMIVFFFAGGIFAYVQLLTRSLQSNQSPSTEPLPSVTKNPEEEERVRKEVLARIDLLNPD